MEGSSSQSLLCHLVYLLLLLRLPMWVSADEFLVLGPKEPTVAVLGGNTTLPCRLHPAMSAENMELRWFRSKFSEAVLIYQNQQEQKEGQMPRYRGRTSLVRDFLTQGEAAVRIDNIQLSDNGLYTCFFKNGDFHENATLEVKVAGVGSAPEVLMEGQEEDGVLLACRALGWFPEPQVQWRGPRREKFMTFSEAHIQDADGLFHVEASLVVRDSFVGKVTCSILNPILGQEKAKAISIPESFFPQSSPWKPAFAVSMSLLVLVIFGAGYFLKKESSAKVQAQQEKKSLQLSKEKDRQKTEEALKTRDELQAEMDRRNEVHQDALTKAQQNVEWLKNQFQTWSVTLDPCSAHPDLALSQGNTRLTFKDACISWKYDKCSVLGREGITSGQYYWEVEVRNDERGTWALGICMEDVDRTNDVRASPESGFWVVKWWEDRFYACTTTRLPITVWQFPRRVGIFLDYDNGSVSFYNLTDGSHIFSFSSVSFTGTVLPYFMVRSGNMSLTICSAVSGLEGLPARLRDSYCQGSSNASGEGLSSDSGSVCAPSGAESPLLPDDPEAMPP